MSWKDQHKAEAEKVAESLISKHLNCRNERFSAQYHGKKAIHKVIQGLTHQELKKLKDAIDYLKKTESEATE